MHFPGPGLRRAFAAGLAALLVLAQAAPAWAAPPVWRLKGRRAEIVLFGSVHLLSPGLAWRTPALAADLAKAKTVWFEIPVDAATRGRAAQAAVAASRLPGGGSLSALLSSEGRARLERVSAALGVPARAFDGYRPWFAEVSLTLLQLQAKGADQSSGVEEVLSRSAPAGARRQAFETPEEQVRLLADTPLADQVASLEESLRQIEEEPDGFAALEKAWVDGDLAWLDREAVEPMRKAAPKLYERLVTARNRRWADRIERLLAGSESAFIVVGVGHLVGPEGVPALLRRRGVTVEGP
jgi:uncharacterized protein YbaP (TraB family)